MVTAKEQIAVDKFNKLMNDMNDAKEALLAEHDSDDEDEDNGKDGILQQAITLALEQGRGWKPGEKEEYIKQLLDDDFIPPLFANSVEEVEKSGLQEAFTSLIYDNESPTTLMLQFKTKGTDAFNNGKRNVVKNMQYYRDAINFWYESMAWANKIVPISDGDYAYADTTDDITYNTVQLNSLKGTLCSNIALAHMQLCNWGYVRDECKKGIELYDNTNIKLWYKLIKAYEMLKEYELAGDCIDSALALDNNDKDILKLKKLLNDKITKSRSLRQQRERNRSQRSAAVKNVWKHCTQNNVSLGRIPLVATVTDDEIDLDDDDNNDGSTIESRWHNHLPNSGLLPQPNDTGINSLSWSWPCMFVYPSHNQSDFIKDFNEDEIIAYRMAQVFPELEDDDSSTEKSTTSMPWDYNNEFVCSQLAVYFEVHMDALQQARVHQQPRSAAANDNNSTTTTTTGKKKIKKRIVQHPDSVELLQDQESCMKYYESSRALKGDEGSEMAAVVRAIERKHLNKQRSAWKKVHKTLWSKPDPCPVVRVHPAVTLRDVLTDYRMVVPNFLVTFIMIPENHPIHAKFLEEHKCIGILEPKEIE